METAFLCRSYAGLEEYQKEAEKGYSRKSAEIEQRVRWLREQHEGWGKHRIADEIAMANNWVPLVSPNTVRRIVEKANLWKPEEKMQKKFLKNRSPHSRRAWTGDQC